MPFSTDLAHAHRLDAADPLAPFRHRFVVADPDLVYVDGNSLGRLPLATADRLRQVVEQEWGRQLIRGWNEGWMDLAARIGAKIARLIGAQADEVLVADSTSVNLFKLAVAALAARPDRSRIVTDDLNFPSDLYILQGVQRLAGRPVDVVRVPSPDGIHGPVEGLAAAIDDRTALVTLTHTVFKSGYSYDMAPITALAHRAGALMLWDLSHAAGSVPVNLNGAGADLAVGCTYKYLNGGPGAPAFLYVRRDLQSELANPISGWMGQRRMFDFDLAYEPAPGLRRFLTGTPPILALAAIEPGVDMLLAAGMDRVRAKSRQQTGYLVDLWRAVLAPLGFRLNSPANPERRGSHVSLGHDAGWQIAQALMAEMGVLPDFRRPDNIRLGLAPLYTTYADVWTAVDRLRQVVAEGRYGAYDAAPAAVT